MMGALTRWLERQFYPVPVDFRKRPDVALPELNATYYGDLGLPQAEFDEVWREIASIFHVPPSRLRPADRFGVELKARVTLGGSSEDLRLGSLLDRYRIGSNALPEIDCVDDVVRVADAARHFRDKGRRKSE